MSSKPSFKVHRSFEIINDEIYPWIASGVGWWPCDPLSPKAVEWLIENEPGFKEQIAQLKNQIANYNPEQSQSIKPTKSKKGSIYIVRAGETNLYKIGLTTASKPESRIKNIQVSSPIQIETIAIFKVDDVERAEADIHQVLKIHRRDGEWFEIKDLKIINKAIKPYGVKIPRK